MAVQDARELEGLDREGNNAPAQSGEEAPELIVLSGMYECNMFMCVCVDRIIRQSGIFV